MTTTGHLDDVATAAASSRQESVCTVIVDHLIGRAVFNSQVGGSGRIEASTDLDQHEPIDPKYVERRVAELLAEREYRPEQYVVIVKFMDTRALRGGTDFDHGVFRLFFWADPIDD